MSHVGLVPLLFCAGLLAGPAAASAGPDFVREIAPGVYVHIGKHIDVDDPGHDDIANLGFVVGGKCVAVIDSGGSIAVGEALRAAIRRITATPVCYVINTHVHFDHVLGNFAFLGDRPDFLGHAELEGAMALNAEFFLHAFAADLGPAPGRDKIVGPTRTVAAELELDLGGRSLHLTAHPTAHTSTDLTVLDEQTGTLFSGDLVVLERVPSLDGSLRGWLQTLETLVALDARRVVPGHGPVSPWPQAAEHAQRYLGVLLSETREAVAAGMFMEEAMEQVGRSERPRWRLFDEVHPRNAIRAYKELEWE